MPYKGEHSCRLEDPDKFDSFRRSNCEQEHEGKCIDVIYGIKDGESEIQALRYKTDKWSEDDARAHCKGRKGTFEAAAPDEEKKGIKPSGLEHRTFELDTIEVRADDDEKPKIRGHAAVFDKLSDDLGGFREKISPGAFSKTIKKDDIRALFNHDPNYILGRNKAGTLTLEEDEKGLYFEIDPPDTSYARDLLVSIDRGDISQCSFAFMVDGKKGEKWDYPEGQLPIRTLDLLKLYDTSPVTYPAYPQTDVKVRSAFARIVCPNCGSEQLQPRDDLGNQMWECLGQCGEIFKAEYGEDSKSVISISWEEFQEAISRAEKGKMNQEDRATVRAAVDKLNSYLEAEGGEPGGPGSRGVTGDAGRRAILRKRLELENIK